MAPTPEASTRAGLAATGGLRALLEGFVEAGGAPFTDLSRARPEHVRDGLVAAVLRMVFARLAEARGLLDEAPHSERQGLWARACALSRRLHAQGGGALFDPGAWPFLEATVGVSDACVGRVREALEVEALEVEALEVEALGAAWEELLGLRLACVDEPSLALAPDGALLGLASLRASPASERAARVAEVTGQAPTARLDAALRAADTVDALAAVLARRAASWRPGVIPPGGVALLPGDARRRSGSHYTPRAVARDVVEATLRPRLEALGDAPRPEALLALRVCDPAMGGGAFLLEACRQLGDALAVAWATHGGGPRHPTDAAREARLRVAERCLYGVDQSPFAVQVARLSLWLEARARGRPFTFVDHALREGDALVGLSRAELTSPEGARRAEAAAREALGDDGARCFHWELEFEEVFARGGFDAVVGNPPWVSYAGRAAQPLAPARRAWYARRYASFAAYKNLQGLFVERVAPMLAPGGRLGLVLPSSMAELAGYAPTRAALDRWCACDPSLPDLGEHTFPGVTQPAMALLATARRERPVAGGDVPWPVARPDLDDVARGLLARLDGPTLPPELFGERGLQTLGDDARHLAPAPDARHSVPLRGGSDIAPFRRGEPSFWADPAWFGARLRPPEAWRAVAVLVRQTARVPMAARGDGVGFRNSILACFEGDGLPAAALVAWLNCAAVRWRHYHLHRDARLGMPQVKVGHLRAIAAPPRALVPTLAAMGEALSARNEGASEEAQRALDDAVFDALGVTPAERARVARDALRWR